MDIVSYESNGIIASNLEGLPESESDKNFWQWQCWNDETFLKGTMGDFAKQNCWGSKLLKVLSSCRIWGMISGGLAGKLIHYSRSTVGLGGTSS